MTIRPAEIVRAYWDGEAGHYHASHPEFRDRSLHPSWGLAHRPETDLRLLSMCATGGLLIDLGCGQGHDAAGFADLGYRVLGIDISTAQLSFAEKHPSTWYAAADAGRLPLGDQVADVVTSDHGAFDHAVPDRLLAEVRRVLRPGGVLVVCTYSPIALACFDPRSGRIVDRLVRSYPTRTVSSNGKIVTTNLGYSAWTTLFRSFGFVVERIEEPLLGAGQRTYFDELVDEGWANRWPLDTMWVVRRR